MEFPSDLSHEMKKKVATGKRSKDKNPAAALDSVQQETLDKILGRWKKTDGVTPFLITKYIENRSILVLQKMVMSIRYSMTQQGGMVSSYPNQISPIPIPEEFGVDSFI